MTKQIIKEDNSLNGITWRKNCWKAIESGDQVKNIKIEVKYRGNSQRPIGFDVKYEINNKKLVKHILNK